MKLLVPMAGAGTRFSQAGYNTPKPFIPVNGVPMVEAVVKSIKVPADEIIFLVQAEHLESQNAEKTLSKLSKRCRIVPVDGVTQGAACTTLLAREFIDSDGPLAIVNSDQIIKWNSRQGLKWMLDADGGMVTFEDTTRNPKWSFAKVDQLGRVTQVAEKSPISHLATAGLYVWTRGSDYVRCADKMIRANDRVNGEFYVCPVYNYGIQDGLKFRVSPADEMWGLGTPEDLDRYLETHS